MWPFRKPEPLRVQMTYIPTHHLRLVGVNKLQQLWVEVPADPHIYWSDRYRCTAEELVFHGHGHWRDVLRVKG